MYRAMFQARELGVLRFISETSILLATVLLFFFPWCSNPVIVVKVLLGIYQRAKTNEFILGPIPSESAVRFLTA